MFIDTNCELAHEIKVLPKEITHQDIGGKEIAIEGEVDIWDLISSAAHGNWACKNFLDRRDDTVDLAAKDLKFYYGKVGGLGYIVASDEIGDANGED